jgi:thioredoxin-related protein
MNPIRRSLLFILLLLPGYLVHAEPSLLLEQTADLQQLGEQSKSRQIPILLMVSQYHCGFCERMKQEVLNPMLLNGDDSNRVLMRELLIDAGESVVNFQGEREAAEQFSDRYKVRVTPTLLFLDSNGKEVAERILGVNTIDYLLFYIEDAIDTATQAMTL